MTVRIIWPVVYWNDTTHRDLITRLNGWFKVALSDHGESFRW